MANKVSDITNGSGNLEDIEEEIGPEVKVIGKVSIYRTIDLNVNLIVKLILAQSKGLNFIAVQFLLVKG